jgi:uncharacterized protein YndB with AHSA1/START domain
MPRRTVRDEAVKTATGKTWREWFSRLDRAGARTMSHGDIARWLGDRKRIESGWWRQMVAVAYERARGRRVLGQTAGAGFQIGVPRTFSSSRARVWRFVTTEPGIRAWLGRTRAFRLRKGARYETVQGIAGEIRAVKARERLRLTWQPKGAKAASTLQLYLTPRGSKTALLFHHEKLSGLAERRRMQRRWREALDRIAEHLA